MSRTKTHLIAGLAVALAGAIPGIALAQSSPGVQAAIDAGTVGEGADGYLGIKGGVAAPIRAEVEQINIKRRAAYTDLAAKRGVTIQDVAASVGCRALSRLGNGQSYRLGDGVWRTKTGAVDLPAYCAG